MPTAAVTEDRFVDAAERLPATPQVFDRLNRALRDPNVSAEEIAAVVQLDPALSARVLRLSNSAIFGRGGQATHLSEAVNRIGFQEIYRLVGAAMSSQLYVAGLSVYGVGGDELWVNSLTTAVAMEYLAEAAGENRRTGYTLGLLRPVGRLVLQRVAVAASCPPMSGRKPTAALVEAWEKTTLGITSMEATHRLFALWHIAPALALPIQYHFRPREDPSQGRFSALLHVASWVAEALGKNLSIEKEAWSLDPEILEQAGLTAEVAEGCVQRTYDTALELETRVHAAVV